MAGISRISRGVYNERTCGAPRRKTNGRMTMATKNDFTQQEWDALQKGVTGAAMLVSLSDRDFTDTFGEVGAMAKYLAGQHVASSSDLIRELAKTKGSGFGLGTSPEKLRAETMDALREAVATLETKSPADVDPYRQLVLGVTEAVASAKGGVVAVETAMMDAIRESLGS
jgi:hypothetical protein